MTAVLGSQLETIEGLEIYAGEGPAAPLVFSHGTMGWDTHDEKLRIGDRQWTMRVSYGRLLERIGRPFGIFLFGFAIMLLAMQLHRSEEHTSELQSLMRISYAVFCLTKKKIHTITIITT